MSVRVAALVLGCALAAGPLDAQVVRYLGVDVGLSSVRFRSTGPGGGEALSGVATGSRARIVLGPVLLETVYSQGHLGGTGTSTPRDLVDGGVFVAARPAPWLAVKAGPHLRAYVAPGGTERWVMWETHARADGPIIAGTLDAHVEGWIALGSAVNVDPGASGAHGAQAGLVVRLWQSPLWARLTYAVDQAKLKNHARTETVEAVVLAIGIGGR